MQSGTVYFDASKYPEYEQAQNRAIRSWKKTIIIINVVMVVASLLVIFEFTVIFEKSNSLSIGVISYLLIALITNGAMFWGTPKIRKYWKENPPRITEKGLEDYRKITSLKEFDRIVFLRSISWHANPNLIALVRGKKKIVRIINIRRLGNLDEFQKVIKKLRPEIQTDLTVKNG